MANNSPAVGAGNCQQQQTAQYQAGSAPPGQQPLQSGGPKPAASGKQGNVLPLWGNEKTMNLNPMILTNILSSPYFKVQLYELKTYHEVVDEIYFKVRPAPRSLGPAGRLPSERWGGSRSPLPRLIRDGQGAAASLWPGTGPGGGGSRKWPLKVPCTRPRREG